ncbi:MAG: flagellin FliC [bacterium]|nr:flagellin FliC [bacterium]
MGLRVNTNIASLTAQRNLHNVTTRLNGNFQRLSSGMRIANAADDAAGLAISERMRSLIRSYGVAARNAQDGISLTQTAEGALNEVNSILNRMRELSMQSANGTLSLADRGTLDVEFQELTLEVDRLADETEFNGLALLDGSLASVTMQVGLESGDTIVVPLEDTTSTALGVDLLDVLDVTGAVDSLAVLDAAIGTLNTARGNLGASQNRLASALRSIFNARENLSAAESRIRDVDVAAESADLTRNTIMQQAAVSVLQQANTQPQIALSLLQG